MIACRDAAIGCWRPFQDGSGRPGELEQARSAGPAVVDHGEAGAVGAAHFDPGVHHPLVRVQRRKVRVAADLEIDIGQQHACCDGQCLPVDVSAACDEYFAPVLAVGQGQRCVDRVGEQAAFGAPIGVATDDDRRAPGQRAANRLKVRRPMISTWPRVAALNSLRSSGNRQGIWLPRPITPPRAQATISVTQGSMASRAVMVPPSYPGALQNRCAVSRRAGLRGPRAPRRRPPPDAPSGGVSRPRAGRTARPLLQPVRMPAPPN